jgi:hypothetical protein
MIIIIHYDSYIMILLPTPILSRCFPPCYPANFMLFLYVKKEKKKKENQNKQKPNVTKHTKPTHT